MVNSLFKVNFPDGHILDVSASHICPAPQEEKQQQRSKKAKKTSPKEITPPVMKEPEVSRETNISNETKRALFLYYLRGDGMWVRVGDIVSVEGGDWPCLLARITEEDNIVKVTLFKISDGKAGEDFVIICSINYISRYCGNKVSVKGGREKVEEDCGREFAKFVSAGVSDDFRLRLRKMVLGHSIRVGIQGGFTNLNCIRVNVGPSDILLDNSIFKFTTMTSSVKYYLINSGDFEFLDSIMGMGWDYKLGKGEDSFFKYVTEVVVKRSGDCCLVVTAKFGNAQFLHSSSYRIDCIRAITHDRDQMSNIVL